ncbi:MAG: MerR family transcriptional regulator [Acidobacteria bacterium]|nr:MerR family transcriptional regulator [Acidobacteriota bacterium]
MPDSLFVEGAPQIPDKMYFRIGEVSRLVGVAPYVLRFWETEFPAISPKQSGRGHRLYRRKDVELFLEIKHLLYEKRFTIEGARKSLKLKVKQPARKTVKPARQAELFDSSSPALEEIRKELVDILRLLG